jgi:DNA-binding HxlR family transcriptional regulator
MIQHRDTDVKTALRSAHSTRGSPAHTEVTMTDTTAASPAQPTEAALGAFRGAPAAPGPTEATACAVREVLDRVGDKWSVYVIHLLGGGTMRFSDLKRSIEGISQRMLTVTLRGLERDGLVTRTVYPVVPPRVDYALTPLGETLLSTVCALVDWSEAHRADIDAARVRYDTREEPALPG